MEALQDAVAQPYAQAGRAFSAAVIFIGHLCAPLSFVVRTHVATLRSSGNKTRLASRRKGRCRSCSANARRHVLPAQHISLVPACRLGTPSKSLQPEQQQPIRAYTRGTALSRSSAARGLLWPVRGLSRSWVLTLRSLVWVICKRRPCLFQACHNFFPSIVIFRAKAFAAHLVHCIHDLFFSYHNRSITHFNFSFSAGQVNSSVMHQLIAPADPLTAEACRL